MGEMKKKKWEGGNHFWNSQDVLQGWYSGGFGFAACLLEISRGNVSAV